MDMLQNARIKWPYVTHLIDPRTAVGLAPPVDETNPGGVMLARVVALGRHRDLETHDGRRMALFPGDLFAGVLGHRYATDQFEAEARCVGATGHIVGIGGVCGQVVSMNSRMIEPTTIEWLGRITDPDGQPLHLSRFRTRPQPLPLSHPTTILSLGAAMNAGKTTTAAQMIRSLTNAGHRVAAAKVTGTACRKDPNFLFDAGAIEVLDFTHAGWPSTAGCSREELLTIASHLRAALAAHQPDFVVLEIADGIIQRETAMLLENEPFRLSIDAVTFAGPDAMSCDAGVRRLQTLGYRVIATAGFVGNSRLAIAEAEAACGIRCLSGEAILAGEMLPILEGLRDATRTPAAAEAAANGRIGLGLRPSPAIPVNVPPGIAARSRPNIAAGAPPDIAASSPPVAAVHRPAAWSFPAR